MLRPAACWALNSRWRLISASLAFLARSSSRLACILPVF